MTTAKGGRPAGLLLNSLAAEHLLGDRPQAWLASAAGIRTPVLSELMAGQRGASRATANDLAAALECDPGVIFPELAEFKTALRVFTANGVES